MASRSEGHLVVWGVPLPEKGLAVEEREYLASLPEDVPSHAWVCHELDRVWHHLGLDNRRSLADQPVDAFYRHPVWLMNGLFSAADPKSASHRHAIADCVANLAPRTVVDVGGGFGELALQISRACPQATVHILEPFPSAIGQARLQKAPDVDFVPALEDGTYDVVIAQDVLEHVEDPIGLAIDLARAVRPGGTAIFANNFTPIIQCHLPRTFHLRRTFPLVMRALGLVRTGRVALAEHAFLFEVPASLAVGRARSAERLSQVVGPAIETALTARRRVLGPRAQPSSMS